MHKLLQVVVCGLAAVSFSALAADEKKSTEVDANTKIQGDTKAGSTGVDAKAGAGASTDIKADKKKGKAKEKSGTSGAGSTTAPAAPAPAPAPAIEAPKKAE